MFEGDDMWLEAHHLDQADVVTMLFTKAQEGVHRPSGEDAENANWRVAVLAGEQTDRSVE